MPGPWSVCEWHSCHRSGEVFCLLGFPGQSSAELQPLDVAVPLLTLPNDSSAQHIECGKQGSCAMTLVIVRHGLCPPLLQGKGRLGAVQRILRRIHAQADDVRTSDHAKS